MIDSFAGPGVFLAHLNDEIKTLAPEIVQKIFPDPEEAKKIVRDMVRDWYRHQAVLSLCLGYHCKPSSYLL